MDKSDHNQQKHDLPDGVAGQCKGISDQIREENRSIRYDKVLAARMRISSGYYNSGHVLRVIASRLLQEGNIV